MICAEIKRTTEGFEVNAEWGGCGNANIVEAFKMHDVDILKVMDNMKVGETKIYNLGYRVNNAFGISKKGIEEKEIDFSK